MARARFTPEMESVLAQMKGKVFKSFAAVKNERWQRIYGNFRINLGKSSIDVECYDHALEFFDGVEDVAYFACRSVDPKSAFEPCEMAAPKTYLVDEVITASRS